MSLRAFGKAVLIGTIAGTIAPTIFSARFGLYVLDQEGGFGSGMYFIIMPTVVTFCIVLTCAVLIGLPITLALRGLKRESKQVYAVVGGGVGLATPILVYFVLGEDFNLVLPLIGAFSGTVTGWTWGSERQAMASRLVG